jgi:hypothetical protein
VAEVTGHLLLIQVMADRKSYTHKGLKGPRSIRVIKFKRPSAIQRLIREESLEIELEEVSLNSPPPYEALSYTWDAQTPDHLIKCHGKFLRITANCERALSRLTTRPTARFWIDSICINQTSIPEKNQQIPLMGEVYGKAERVLVWLGDCTDVSKACVRYLQDIEIISINWMMSGFPIPLPERIHQDLQKVKTSFQGRICFAVWYYYSH